MGLPIGLPDVIHHAYVAADALSEQIPWSLSKYNVPSIWTQTRGKGVRVGVLDTGLDSKQVSQGDLKGAIRNAKDFTDSRVGWQDVHGHGTHVTGTIAGRQGNGIGICGVAPDCEIIMAKALGDDGSGDDINLARAIRYLVDEGCQLINASLGSDFFSQMIADAVAYAVSKGCLIICASGNSGQAVGFPGRLPTVITVGSTNEEGQLSSFSCRGPEQDVAAPGERILSCYKNGGYSVLSGTSMAAPFVTGIFALAISSGVNFNGDAAKAREWLSTVTVDAGAAGQDDEYGLGLFDVQKLLKPATPPPVTPPAEVTEKKIPLGPVDIILHYPAQVGDVVSLSVKPAG